MFRHSPSKRFSTEAKIKQLPKSDSKDTSFDHRIDLSNSSYHFLKPSFQTLGHPPAVSGQIWACLSLMPVTLSSESLLLGIKTSGTDRGFLVARHRVLYLGLIY